MSQFIELIKNYDIINSKGVCMSFITKSRDLDLNNYVLVSNSFISKIMPSLSGSAIKVYLLGLQFLQFDSEINTLDNFEQALNLSVDEITRAFEELESNKLVKISKLDELKIIFLNIDEKTLNFKPIDKSKYGDFCILCQSFFDRELTPNEFKEYVNLIEIEKIEPEALLMIIKYCTETKEKNITANYILTVAKNWISEKILTTAKVEEKIKELELTSEKLKNILLILGIKRNANLDERDMYIKWTKTLGFSTDTILSVAEKMKKKGGMKVLDSKLLKYFSLQLMTFDEISEYEQNKKHYLELAKDICSRLGIYVENLDPVIDNYLNSWLFKGYSDETLKLLAKFCFKSENNSLEKMDIVIQKLYKQGCVNIEAITQYINNLNMIDENIKKIFSALGIARIVTSRDREMYNTWCEGWNISEDLIDYAVSLSVGKNLPLQYLNKVITNFHEKGVNTIEEAQSCKENFINSTENKANMNTRSYSDEELNRLFDNLKEVDIK